MLLALNLWIRFKKNYLLATFVALSNSHFLAFLEFIDCIFLRILRYIYAYRLSIGSLRFSFRPTQSIGLLSYTFLRSTGNEYIIVTMVMLLILLVSLNIRSLLYHDGVLKV